MCRRELRTIKRGELTLEHPVCVWLRKGKFVMYNPYATCKRKEIEEDQLWLGMDTGTNKCIAIGIIYVRAVGAYCTKEDLIERMQVINIRTLDLQKQGFSDILLGDFNAKIDTTGRQIKGENEAGECLIDLTVMTGLDIVNMDPELRGIPTCKPEGGGGENIKPH